LILIGIGALLLVGLAAFFVWQGNSGGGGSPQLAVDQKLIDYGNLKDYTEKSFTITVTNRGTGILRFKEKPYVQVVEGCCPPELTVGSMTLKPGESTTVTSSVFMMHPGMDGKHNYAVHLVTNDSQQPDLVVNVLSNWSE
jgi:hypothetical protein